jgi:pimeloyl-ACP methyl ester carboxylesterase
MNRFILLVTIVLATLSSSWAITLDRQFPIPNYGDIKFRAPQLRNGGEKVVLIHGIYAGSTHKTWSEITPLLDGAGLQVFLLDLPGFGENGILTKKQYSMEFFDNFIISFLEEVVKGPATLVAESLLTTSILKVAALRPELVEKLILLSPTGINSLAAPMPQQEQLYQQLMANDQFARAFTESVYKEDNLRFFLEKTVYDDGLITPQRIKEIQEPGLRPGQQWATLAFVGGQLTRPFSQAVQNVTTPTLMIFGEEAESSGTSDDLLEDPQEFIKIRPDFELAEIPLCGQAVQREKPQITRDLIINFIRQ